MRTNRLPPWIRATLPTATSEAKIRSNTYGKGLATVCTEARCPNRGDCAAQGTATFLILGDKCTRNCRFCAVDHSTAPAPPRPEEPELVAAAVASLGLRYAVVTSVTRDDLPDGGASIFAETIGAIRRNSPDVHIEVLIPDFRGSKSALETVVKARPDIINHNLETVPRLYSRLRPQASYERSLELLRGVRDCDPEIFTKSGIMVGAGETREEISALVEDLVETGCRVLTIGQYLQPTPRHHPVIRYLPPREFQELKKSALETGVQIVAAAPLVRSSYKAREIFAQLKNATRPASAPES